MLLSSLQNNSSSDESLFIVSSLHHHHCTSGFLDNITRTHKRGQMEDRDDDVKEVSSRK